MKKFLIILMSFLSMSCYASSDPQSIVVSVPSAKFRSATIEDCSNPVVTLTQGAGSIDYELDGQLDCTFVRKALFFAGASDDIAGELIRVNLTFDKETLTLIRVSIHQGNNLIENAAELERLASRL